MRILLIEDDAPMGSKLGERLRAAGFAVDVVDTAARGRDWAGLDTPDRDAIDAIVMDPGLPGEESLHLLQAWRHNAATTPMVVLASRGRWQDKVQALDAGADDFVVKPVRFDELLARLHVMLRRRHGGNGDWIERDGLRLDPRGRKAELNGNALSLTRMEFRLLHLFVANPGHVLSQKDILDHLYDEHSERQLNAVEVLISRLRRKIGSTRIETVRGLGYRFVS